MNKENAIIINGVKHILVDDNDEHCTKESCSLYDICDTYICVEIFNKYNSHFEIKED